ncbi:MAG: 2-C-methyl-D-erythritol 4-phosphate cytidylyltransferase [bacterium]|jgi:2-C-methyl-D-erythritol 4-phosphate cytidylyltransferase
MIGLILLGYGKSKRFLKSLINNDTLNLINNTKLYNYLLDSMKINFNKILLKIRDNKNIMDFSIEVFKNITNLIKTVVFVIDLNIDIKKYENDFNEILLTEGGSLRQISSYKGIQKLKESKYFNEIEYIIIHDLARPLINLKMINDLIDSIKDYDGCTLYINTLDSTAFEFDKNLSYIDREKILLIQTPQIFKKNAIINAHENAKYEKDIFTDDLSILEFYTTFKINYIPGHKFNIKLTDINDYLIIFNLLNFLIDNNLYQNYLQGKL